MQQLNRMRFIQLVGTFVVAHALSLSQEYSTTRIPLDLAIEKQLLVRGEPPVSTITWFRGRHLQDAKEALEQRAKSILSQNPWLNGRIVGGCLEYQKPVANQEIVNAGSPLDRLLSVSELFDKTVEHTRIENSNGPLWKVTVVPSIGEDHFGLILSVSHYVCDGHSFYRIYDYLTSNCPIDALEMQPPMNSDALAKKMIGSTGWDFFSGVWPYVKGACGVLETIVMKPPSQERWLEVDAKEMQKFKDAQKFENGIDYVSTNDVLTSWMFRSTRCPVGFLCTNYRGKLEGHGPVLGRNFWGVLVYSPNLYGSAVKIRKNMQEAEPPSLPDPVEFITSPVSIVSSWPNPQSLVSSAFQAIEHLPLYDFASFCPARYCVLRTWTIMPKRTGVYIAGDSRILNHVSDAPFLKPLARISFPCGQL